MNIFATPKTFADALGNMLATYYPEAVQRVTLVDGMIPGTLRVYLHGDPAIIEPLLPEMDIHLDWLRTEYGPPGVEVLASAVRDARVCG